MRTIVNRSTTESEILLSIEEFAELHDLTMVVNEREWVSPIDSRRFYAHFEGIEIKDGSVLISEFGNGVTPELAIQNYAKEINGKLLVFHAMGDDRKEFYAWLKE